MACGGDSSKKEIAQTDHIQMGFWGHLESVGEFASQTLHLIFTPAGHPYKVCIPQYMVQEFPGLQAEVEASILIWSHYIGRNIKVEVLVEDIPRQQSGQSSIDQLEIGYNICGGADLVLGLSDIVATGHTELNTFYSPTRNRQGKFNVISFKRSLMLNSKIDWVTLEQQTGTIRDKQQILDLYKARNTVVYTGYEKNLTIRTIVHEMGHVFGMCDQYPLAGNTSNCDIEHATKDEKGQIVLVDHSTMAKGDGLYELYLTDDDITGIRELAERFPKVSHMSYEDFMKIPIAAEPNEAVKYVELLSQRHEGNNFVFEIAIFTRGKVSYRLDVKLVGDTRYQTTINNSANGPMNYGKYEFKVGLPDGLKVEKARFIIESKGEAPVILE